MTALLLSMLALTQALEGPSARRWLVYGLAVVAVFYLQLFAVYAIVPHALLAIRRRQLRAWGVTFSVALAAALPLAWWAGHQTAEIAWIPRLMLADPTVAPNGHPSRSDQIGGRDRGPTAVAAALRRAPGIFVISYTITIPKPKGSGAVRAELDALSNRTAVWHARYGDIYVTLFSHRL